MKIAARFQSFPAYVPIEPFEVLSERLGIPAGQIVKLDANENPYGPSPRARAALAQLAFAHIYPDPESRALRLALHEMTGVPMEHLLAGAGADELIDLLLRVVLEPDDTVINLPPTFGMYDFDTRLNAGQVLDIPRRADFSIDLPAVQQAVAAHHPKVIFVTTPNNPDGSLPDPSELDELLALPLLVVIDEAYIEFTRQGGRLGEKLSRIGQVAQRENLVVLRTFSKWAGLAGLRVGYGAFPAWLMPTLWKAKQPYNVSVAASQAAIASIADLDWLAQNVAQLRTERERLFAALQTIPFLRPFPSEANYILCAVNEGSALAIKQRLMKQGVLVRHYDTALLRDYIRISVGRPYDSDVVLAALRGQTLPQPPMPELAMRKARVHRQTHETEVTINLNLDGSGLCAIDTGLPFLDHMLTQVAVHGLFDLDLRTRGDLHIDPHHSLEDTALALGQAFAAALGHRAGIQRAASFQYPMDECLASVAIDFSGRPYLVAALDWRGAEVGGLPVTLITHFLESFAVQARCTLHVQVVNGRDDHHQAEAIFKALGRALAGAVAIDPRRAGRVPSSKGVL